MNAYEEKLEQLVLYIDNIKKEITAIREFAKSNDLLNEQSYIDYENFLNAYSVMDPEK